MSIVVAVVLIILGILVLLVVLASLTSDTYSIHATIIINRPSHIVYDFVKYLKHADRYNKWTMLDPNIKRSFIGSDGTVGFVSYWDSEVKQIGKGEQEITGVDEGRRVDYEIRFEKPFQNTASAHISTSPVSESKTEVKWVFGGKRNIVLKMIHLVFNLPTMLQKDLTESLHNMKRVLED